MSRAMACGLCNSVQSRPEFRNKDNVSVRPPFPLDLELLNFTCVSCRAPLRQLRSPSQPSLETCWNQWSERMVSEEDYEVLLRRRRRPRLDGTCMVHVVWAWHPMIGDPQWDRRVVQQIDQDEHLRDVSTATLLVLPPGPYDKSWWLEAVGGRFNEVWLIREHVMQGREGPWPSVRAELSLTYTLSSWGLQRTKHYWPSACLSGRDYCPLASDRELEEAWLDFVRRNVQIGAGDER